MNISVRIPKNLSDSVTVEVNGAKGTECLLATRRLREQLSAAAPLKRKDDFHQMVVGEDYAQVGN